MAALFSIGDTVRLKSGGPTMTVESINGTIVYCVWYRPDEFLRNYFPESTIVIYRIP